MTEIGIAFLAGAVAVGFGFWLGGWWLERKAEAPDAPVTEPPAPVTPLADPGSVIRETGIAIQAALAAANPPPTAPSAADSASVRDPDAVLEDNEYDWSLDWVPDDEPGAVAGMRAPDGTVIGARHYTGEVEVVPGEEWEDLL